MMQPNRVERRNAPPFVEVQRQRRAWDWAWISVSCSLLFLVVLAWARLGILERREFELYHGLPSALGDWYTLLRAFSLIGITSAPHDLGIALFVFCALAVAATLAFQRRIAALLFLIACATLAAVVPWLMHTLVIHPLPAIAGGRSFPSGHATAAVVGFGLTAFLARLWSPNQVVTCGVLLLAALGATVLIASAVTFHYVSDVVGGIALGVAMLSAGMAVMESWSVHPGR